MARQRTVRAKRSTKPAEEDTAISEDAPVAGDTAIDVPNNDLPIEEPDGQTIEGEEIPESTGSGAQATTPRPAIKKTINRRGARTRRRVEQVDGSEATIEALKRRRDEARNEGVQHENVTSNVNDPPPDSSKQAVENRPSTPSPKQVEPQEPPSPVQATPVREALSTADTGSVAQGRGRQQRRGSTLKAEGTPMAESSLLILQKFQRRSRQPSVLRMVTKGGASAVIDNDDDDDDLSSFDFGDASILMNSSPAAPKHPDYATIIPGTPIPNTQETVNATSLELGQIIESTQTDIVIPPTGESAATLPQSSIPLIVPPSTDSLLIQKRKRDSSQLPSQFPPPPSSPPILKALLPRIDSGSDDEPLSDVPSLSDDDFPDLESESELRDNEDNKEDILAPPLSSSDIESEDEPERPTKVSKNNRAQNVKSAKRQSLTTSTLTSLLPRPRSRRHVPSPSDDESEKEAPSRRNRRAPLKLETAPAGNRKAGASTHSTPFKKTYSRRSLPAEPAQDEDQPPSEDEDDGEGNESDTTVVAPPPANKELSAAAKKFAEIDTWTMEYESVSQSTNDEEIGAY